MFYGTVPVKNNINNHQYIKILFLLAQKKLLRIVFFVLVFLNHLLPKFQICHLYIYTYSDYHMYICIKSVHRLFCFCFPHQQKTAQSPSSSSSFQLICQFFRSPSLTLSLSLLCLHLHLTVNHFVMIWSHCHALHVNRYTFYVYALRNRKKSSPKVCFSFLSLSSHVRLIHRIESTTIYMHTYIIYMYLKHALCFEYTSLSFSLSPLLLLFSF